MTPKRWEELLAMDILELVLTIQRFLHTEHSPEEANEYIKVFEEYERRHCVAQR